VAGANKTRGATIKNQLNTEIAACDKKQKEQEHKHAHDERALSSLLTPPVQALHTAAVRVPCDALRNKCERISCFFQTTTDAGTAILSDDQTIA
jgi:hypothetical protein